MTMTDRPERRPGADKPSFPDRPYAATGPRGLSWSRWRIESAAQFRARVLEDAARLGVVPWFAGEPRPGLAPQPVEQPAAGGVYASFDHA
jgi:hypothetical protein